jgi:hypothetical protein
MADRSSVLLTSFLVVDSHNLGRTFQLRAIVATLVLLWHLASSASADSLIKSKNQ